MTSGDPSGYGDPTWPPKRYLPPDPDMLAAASEVKAIEEVFTYHPPTGDQPARYQAIRDQAKLLAYTIHHACPPSPDRTAAIRHLAEAVMTANKAIATKGAAYR